MIRYLTILAPLAAAAALGSFDVPVASAQTARDVNCRKCVDKRDIADGAVTDQKLKRRAVTKRKIMNGAVTAAKLGDDVTALGLSGVAVIAAADLRPTIDIAEHFFSFLGGYVAGRGTFVCYAAPVHLPERVLITELEIVFWDNDSAGDFGAALSRAVLTGSGGAEGLANVTTAGSEPAVRQLSETAILDPVVDLMNFTYFVWTCLTNANQRVYALRVYYE